MFITFSGVWPKSLRSWLLLTAIFFAVFSFSVYKVLAVQSITTATGGTGISLDTTTASGGSSTYVNLGTISIVEQNVGEINLGLHTFTLPNGWQIDPGSVITVGANWAVSGLSLSHPTTITPDNSTQFSINVNAVSNNQAATISFQGLRVVPTGTTPSTGSITHTVGTITGVTNGTTNFGTLSTVPGVATNLRVTSDNSTPNAGDTVNLTIKAYDQFGNLVDSGTNNYTGSKNLTFFFNNSEVAAAHQSPNLTNPTTGGSNLGTQIAVTFTNGVSSNVALLAYKAESVGVDVSDGTINSTGSASYDADMTVNPGVANHTTYTTEPSSTVSVDNNFDGQPVVEIRDQYDNLRNADTDTVTITAFTDNACTSAASGVVAGNSVSASGGVGMFTNLAYRKSAQDTYFKATVGSLTADCSNSAINLAHGVATKLAFTTQPAVAGGATVDVTLADQPVVVIQDQWGNTATSDSSTNVTLSDVLASDNSTDASGSLRTTLTVTASSGIVTFSGIGYDKLDTIHIKATNNGGYTDVVSNVDITLLAGAPALVNITTQPANSGGTVDNVLTTIPAVTVTDQFGNGIAGASVTVAIANSGTGSALRNTSATADGNGLAQFTTLGYSKSGEAFDLKFTSGAINSVDSSVVVALNPGAADHVTYTTQPASTGTVDVVFTTQPVVEVRDQYDNLRNTDGSTVAVTAFTDNTCTNVAGGTIGGNSVVASNGVATFSSLVYRKAGEDTYFKAELSGSTTACSTTAVNLNPGAIDSYDVTPGSTAVAVDEVFTVTVTAKDAYGNVVTTNNSTTVNLSGGSFVFDSNANGTFGEGGDDQKNLTAGTFTLNTKDSTAETAQVAASDGSKSGNSANITVSVLNDIYVATTGNDANPGTAVSPKVTIQAAVNAVATSGTVNVDAGTYNESVTVGKALTVQKKSGAVSDPIITANDSWGFKLTAASITIDGFNIQITAGASTNDQAIRLEDADSAVIQNNTISTTGSSALGIWACGSNNSCNPSDNVQIKKNTITVGDVGTGIYLDYSNPGYVGWVIGGSASDGNTINATAVDNSNPIEFYDAAGEISYNTINGRSTGGNAILIKTNLSDVTQAIKIKNNTINGGGGSGMVYIGADKNSSVINSTSNEVSGNTFSNWAATTGAGLRLVNLNGTVSGFTVYGNTFTNPSTSDTVSAKDDTSGGNAWDNGTVGNTWNDFSNNANYPVTYAISGSAGDTDALPVGRLDAAQSTVGVSPTSVSTDGGATATITITAKDGSGNVLAGIASGKYAITSTGNGNTITQVASSSDVNGQATGTIASTVAEAKTVSVTIGGVNITGVSGSNQVTFTPGALNSIIFLTQPEDGAQAGVAFSPQPGVMLKDAQGNQLTNDSATQVTFAAFLSDGTTPGTGTLGGTVTVTVSGGLATTTDLFYTETDQIKLKATAGGKSVFSNLITGVAGPAANLRVTAASATPTAGVADELTITAYDAYNHVAVSYVGAKNLIFSGLASSTNGSIPQVEGVDLSTATSVNFTNGASDSNVATLVAYKAESASLDVSDGTIDSTGDANYDVDLTVAANSFGSFNVAPATTAPTAGSSFNVTVTAADAYGNAVTSYTGTISFFVTATDYTLPTTLYTFVGGDSGVKTFSVTFKVVESNKTITVTDISDGTKTGTSPNISPISSDTTAPTVESWTPVDGTTGVSVTTQVIIEFSEAIDASTVQVGNVELRDYTSNNPVTVTYTQQNSNKRVILTPNSSLAYGTQYYIFIGTGLRDVSGNQFAGNTWYANQKDSHEFTTKQALVVNSVTLEQGTATAFDSFANGWRYRFEVTANDSNETQLQLRLDDWAKSGGVGTVATDGNTYLLINTVTGSSFASTGLTESDITGGSGSIGSYAVVSDANYTGAGIVTIVDNDSGTAGNQMTFYVYVRVPSGTPAGFYGTNYGVKTN